ncbi:ubiquinone biosynthesis O-methyltransferase-like [Solenopsis invicta]|uniref:ubiquinone biosynthesis O-methyltransferase-like n=1 Tax=Solenopsis invicta TaxID=13686 RepID=UPI000E33F1FF|nr:ubiquinone biosynthesis O-methyltransferase-like [Solenopsis invicta]
MLASKYAFKCITEPWKKLFSEAGNIIRTNKIVRQLSTIDPKDIEHHTAQKNIWWDYNITKTLHEFNPIRIQFVKNGLAKAGFKIQNSNLPLEGIKIADVGCGGGILSEGLAKLGAQVTGIDPSEGLINIAKEHAKLNSNISEKVNYIHTTVEDFAQKEKETYDVVVTSEVVEHVTDPQQFLKGCVNLVKPGKSIFVTTINKTLASLLFVIIADEYIFSAIPRGTHQWNKFIPPHEVQRILKNYGCETKMIQGFKLNGIKREWNLSSSVSTFYGLHAIKNEETDI